MQEVSEDLAPKIKTLQANLEVVKHIMKFFSIEVWAPFNEKYMEFRDIDPDNVRAPVTFQFITQFVSKL